MWKEVTVDVPLGQDVYRVAFPDSPTMRSVLTQVFNGTEYPIGFPEDYRPQTILDIGANVGAAAIWFHHHFPDAAIHCYEPSPTNFACLQRNIAPFACMHAYGYGLMDQNLETDLFLGTQHSAQSSIVRYSDFQRIAETIQLRRAAEECRERGFARISILKIDTEGCEVPILRDLGEWLPRVDFSYVEYHSEEDRRVIDQLMAEHCYLLHCRVQRGNLGMMVFGAKAIVERQPALVAPAISWFRDH